MGWGLGLACVGSPREALHPLMSGWGMGGRWRGGGEVEGGETVVHV